MGDGLKLRRADKTSDQSHDGTSWPELGEAGVDLLSFETETGIGQASRN